MSSRLSSIREHVEQKHAESWAVLSQLSPGDFGRRAYTDEGAEWTVRDALAHLADAERGQFRQIQRLLAGKSTIPADFDLHRWNRGVVAKRAEQSAPDLLAEIYAGYQEGLALLDTITDEADFDRVGRHARGDDISVEDFFRRIATHRANHAQEIQLAINLGKETIRRV